MERFDLGFELDFNKITNENIIDFISLVFDIDKSKDIDYIYWNPLGNYIYWWDGCTNAFYICRKHIKTKFMPYYLHSDMKKAIGYLENFKK